MQRLRRHLCILTVSYLRSLLIIVDMSLQMRHGHTVLALFRYHGKSFTMPILFGAADGILVSGHLSSSLYGPTRSRRRANALNFHVSLSGATSSTSLHSSDGSARIVSATRSPTSSHAMLRCVRLRTMCSDTWSSTSKAWIRIT